MLGVVVACQRNILEPDLHWLYEYWPVIKVVLASQFGSPILDCCSVLGLQHNKQREELHRLQAKHPELADKLAAQVSHAQWQHSSNS